MPEAKLPHPQGKPCWLDYYAEDYTAAVAFYRELFGWTGEPNEEFGGYTVLRTGGGYTVAGIGPSMPDTPSSPVWNLYFAVDDIAASAERIGALGGAKFVGPDTVPQTGTFVFGADPAGAQFGLWQPGPFVGFEGEGETGSQIWFELETNQGVPSAEFYAALLGVETAAVPGMDDYWLVSVAGEQAAGIWQVSGGEQAQAARPHWNPYFQVADTDAAVSTAVAAGGSLVNEAQDSPFGRLAKLRDPLGAEFSVIDPQRRSAQ